jgi:hypothetical protein
VSYSRFGASYDWRHGQHVSKVRQAILALDDPGINNGELAATLYGPSTGRCLKLSSFERDLTELKGP